MTRNDFFKRTLAGILVAVGLSKVTRTEGRSVFNVQKLKERLDFLKRNPPMVLTPDEIKDSGSGACLYFNQVPKNGLLMTKVVDHANQPFYICERIVRPDGSGWLSIKPFQSFTYIQGNTFAIVKIHSPENGI